MKPNEIRICVEYNADKFVVVMCHCMHICWTLTFSGSMFNSSFYMFLQVVQFVPVSTSLGIRVQDRCVVSLG